MTRKEASEPDHVMLDRIEMSRTAATAQKKFTQNRSPLCAVPGPNDPQDRCALQTTGRIYKDT